MTAFETEWKRVCGNVGNNDGISKGIANLFWNAAIDHAAKIAEEAYPDDGKYDIARAIREEAER